MSVINGTNGNDNLIGTDGADTINGLAGNDRIDGKAGDDLIYGGAGNDTLIGGPGIDTLVGGTGDDAYYVTSYKDVIQEKAGEGTDTVYSNVNYTLPDNVERLYISGIATHATGNSGDNIIWDQTAAAPGKTVTLDGGAGQDEIHGGAADNVIIGGAGIDNTWGGAGADRFVYRPGDLGNGYESGEMLNDFQTGVDKIDLSAYDSQITGGGHFTFIGDAQFSGKAGELASYPSKFPGGGGTGAEYSWVVGDTNGDGNPDFALFVLGDKPVATDFIL